MSAVLVLSRRWAVGLTVPDRMGITHSRSTVSLGNYSTRLKNILQNDVRSPVCNAAHTTLPTLLTGIHMSFSQDRFTWRYQTVEFYWDCRTKLDDGSRMCIVCWFLCASNLPLSLLQCVDADRHQLASLVPPPLDASPPLPNATLTVFPDGHRNLLFDHIVLSSLVIERKLQLMV